MENFNTQSLFNGFSITSTEETILGGNQFKKDSKRLVWTDDSNETPQQKLSRATTAAVDIENVTLHPMQIRTFIIKVEKNV